MEDLLDIAIHESQRAREIKHRGNELLRDGDYLGAYDCYSKALKVAPPLSGISYRAFMERHFEDLELRASLFANRALAAWRLGWLLVCIQDCTSSIAELQLLEDKDQGEGVGSDLVSQILQGRLLKRYSCRRASAWSALGFGQRGGPLPEKELPEEISWSSLPDVAQRCVASYLPLGILGRLLLSCREAAAWSKGLWHHHVATLLGGLSLRPSSAVFGVTCYVHLTSEHRRDSAHEGLTDVLSCSDCEEELHLVPHLLDVFSCFPPIVVDIGTGYTKIGFAGSAPSLVLPNRGVAGGDLSIDRGLFQGPAGQLVDFLSKAVFGSLGAKPQDHPVLMCLPVFRDPELEDTSRLDPAYSDVPRSLKITFNKLGIQRACVVHSAKLALLCHGLQSGLVLDIGLGHTRVIPVLHGTVLRDAVCVETIGAANCTNFLLDQLPSRSEAATASGFKVMMITKAIKETYGFVAACAEEVGMAPVHELPELSKVLGAEVAWGRELAMVGEMFFNPSITSSRHSYFGSASEPPRLSLVALLQKALGRCPAEAQQEMRSVVLAGGTASLPGMQSRLQSELANLEIRVLPFVPEPAWVGGSLAILSCAKR